jgi:hypothetical protein
MLSNEILNKHIWEGWRVIDFINELELPYSYCKKFETRDDLKKWCMENQPYYKKYIKGVVDYFWSKEQEKKRMFNY